MSTRWEFKRQYGAGHIPQFVYRWTCGADVCYGRAVVDDFGNLVVVS